jgi:hypothetical protein
LLCLAPIERFVSIIPASSNSSINLPFFIIFSLPPSFLLSSIFKTTRDSGFGLLIEYIGISSIVVTSSSGRGCSSYQLSYELLPYLNNGLT